MKGIEVRNSDVRSHSFEEIFVAMPQRARDSVWRVGDYRDFEGDAHFEVIDNTNGSEVAALNAGSKKLAYDQLLDAAKRSGQVVWASFFGYENGVGTRPWIRVSAVDSSFWLIETTDETTLDYLRGQFSNVRDSWHNEY